MDGYAVRFAANEDIPYVMEFIGTYWRKNHILSRDRDLFEWQYRNNGKLNMVIGEDGNGTLQGILGYIPYGKDEKKDICLALWKAREGTAFLGVRLLMFLLKEEPHRNVFCNGINRKTTADIYRRFDMKIGKLKHYYRLCDAAEYKIAKINEKKLPAAAEDMGIKLVLAGSMEELEDALDGSVFLKEKVPAKSREYISKRYFNHPSYRYLVYAVSEEGKKAAAAIMLRVQECNASKALRVIDLIGDVSVLGKMSYCLDGVAQQCQAEYIDIYETGLDDSMLIGAGWTETGDNGNIIPDYFAPYEACNVDIFYSTTDSSIVLLKGDGDQDRPN